MFFFNETTTILTILEHSVFTLYRRSVNTYDNIRHRSCFKTSNIMIVDLWLDKVTSTQFCSARVVRNNNMTVAEEFYVINKQFLLTILRIAEFLVIFSCVENSCLRINILICWARWKKTSSYSMSRVFGLCIILIVLSPNI